MNSDIAKRFSENKVCVLIWIKGIDITVDEPEIVKAIGLKQVVDLYYPTIIMVEFDDRNEAEEYVKSLEMWKENLYAALWINSVFQCENT